MSIEIKKDPDYKPTKLAQFWGKAFSSLFLGTLFLAIGIIAVGILHQLYQAWFE